MQLRLPLVEQGADVLVREVDVGQFVLTGEPVAMMGSGSQVAATLVSGSNQPVLYVEFRKDGTPVDPSPWWAASEGEKVRG